MQVDSRPKRGITPLFWVPQTELEHVKLNRGIIKFLSILYHLRQSPHYTRFYLATVCKSIAEQENSKVKNQQYFLSRKAAKSMFSNSQWQPETQYSGVTGVGACKIEHA